MGAALTGGTLDGRRAGGCCADGCRGVVGQCRGGLTAGWRTAGCSCAASAWLSAACAARRRDPQLEQQLREASSRAETEAQRRTELERQAAELRAQLSAALLKAAEAEALPGLRRELAGAQAEAARLGQQGQQLEQEGRELRRQLDAATAAHKAAAAEADERQRATDELATAHAVVQQQLREELEGLQVCLGGGVLSHDVGRQQVGFEQTSQARPQFLLLIRVQLTFRCILCLLLPSMATTPGCMLTVLLLVVPGARARWRS